MTEETSKVEVAAQGTEPVARRRPKGRLRRRLLRAGSALALVAASAAVAGKVYLDRVESRALRFAQAGSSLNTFLKGYIDYLRSRDIPALLALYDEGSAGPHARPWDEEKLSDRDGVEVYTWADRDPEPSARDGLRRQAQWQLDRFGEIESGKFPIASIESMGNDGGAVIRAVLWLRGSTPDRRARESWTTLRLRLRPEGPTWKIAGQELVGGRTVIGPRRGFTDITREAGITFESGHNP